MILVWLIIIPLAAGFLGWALGRKADFWPRWISLIGSAISFMLAIVLWMKASTHVEFTGGSVWLAQVKWVWIPQFGISFQLSMDGLSLLMVLLTGFLGTMAVAASWTGIGKHVGSFHLNLMLVLAGITGVFLATDLFLFYFFWELMLVPMYFLIDVWGHENRHYAAVKFFIFTQLGGLLMFLAMVGLYFVHGRATGEYTFDYFRLLNTSMSPSVANGLMLGFLIAFLVKLPAIPFHTWLPDAHTEAPTAGSVILAGLLLKTGAYGLLRFAIPLFPRAAEQIAPLAMLFGVVGILYGAALAFAQTDLKRLVAYTSVSHLGFVLLGAFARNQLALQGAVMQMICHGISTSALFILVGGLQDRLGTRDINRMGGLWSAIPFIGGSAMFFALASIGLPGLGNFVGEFLVLLGAYQVNAAIAVLASIGLVMATIYSLWMIQVTFFGHRKDSTKIPDLGVRDRVVMAAMMLVLMWLGLFPQSVLNMAGAALSGIQSAAAAGGVP